MKHEYKCCPHHLSSGTSLFQTLRCITQSALITDWTKQENKGGGNSSCKAKIMFTLAIYAGSIHFLRSTTLDGSFLKGMAQIKCRGKQASFLFCGEKKTQNTVYRHTSSLEKLRLTTELPVSCMLPEWSLEKSPDRTHGGDPSAECAAGAPARTVCTTPVPTVTAETRGLRSQADLFLFELDFVSLEFQFLSFQDG